MRACVRVCMGPVSEADPEPTPWTQYCSWPSSYASHGAFQNQWVPSVEGHCMLILLEVIFLWDEPHFTSRMQPGSQEVRKACICVQAQLPCVTQPSPESSQLCGAGAGITSGRVPGGSVMECTFLGSSGPFSEPPNHHSSRSITSGKHQDSTQPKHLLQCFWHQGSWYLPQLPSWG